ncbi:hypothetical protein CVS47_01687 [Microbacterium lemovicicum]|uniref:DUF4397 domain-containing protein n=1 Tax=Microbacterium lemovicicum TaxID=1072463 RepID=A0A3S9WAG3_9MICO|nr:DUF4397 domain-containing protein [Microbacterium lemovicicum]AZS37062.1 hypothetical protein CVS47_01687 [Microbacterium lemovicicum]
MSTTRIVRAGIVAALTALAVTVSIAAPASAASPSTAAAPSAVEQPGWLRLGHFSPDTKQVDVRVASISGGDPVLELNSVGYGDVSDYRVLPAGTYTVSMISAGSGDWSKVAISATVSVASADATTVAAYGPNSALQVRAFEDDLTTPTPGNARIRVVQASTLSPSVDVKTSTGLAVATGAKSGTATTYAEVPAGPWTLDLTAAGGKTDRVDVNVADGSVTTLFVLDNAQGGLTIVPILDSADVGLTPVGGVQTGGGFLASAQARGVGGAGLHALLS